MPNSRSDPSIHIPGVGGTRVSIAAQGEDAGAGASTAVPDRSLIKVVARAQRWFDDVASGRKQSIREAAQAASLSDRYVSRTVPLALLAPDIVEAILAGTQPVELTAEKLTRLSDLPAAWARQRAVLGLAQRRSIRRKANRPNLARRERGAPVR